MSASRYRKFMKLIENWPPDKTKQGRDLGEFIRKQVAIQFRQGEATSIPDEQDCDKKYESLNRIVMDVHKKSYPRRRDYGSTGEDLETCKNITSTDSVEYFKDLTDKDKKS